MEKLHVGDRITTTDSFSLSFDGDNEIDAALLGLSISNVAFVVNQLASDDSTSPECKLRVSAFKEGSFEVLYCVMVVAGLQQAMGYSLNDAALIFGILRSMFDIKKLLKGEKPVAVIENEREGTIHVTCPQGSEIIAPIGSRIIFTPTVERKISEISEAVSLHNPDGGFRLTSGHDSVHYDHEAVQDIAKPIPITEFGPSESVHTVNVTLPIRKIDLLGAAAWSFLYGQRTIQATIADQEFLKSVHGGKLSYKAGDKLSVELTIRTKLSSDGIPIRESYTIEKVYEHIPSNAQIGGAQLQV